MIFKKLLACATPLSLSLCIFSSYASAAEENFEATTERQVLIPERPPADAHYTEDYENFINGFREWFNTDLNRIENVVPAIPIIPIIAQNCIISMYRSFCNPVIGPDLVRAVCEHGNFGWLTQNRRTDTFAQVARHATTIVPTTENNLYFFVRLVLISNSTRFARGSSLYRFYLAASQLLQNLNGLITRYMEVQGNR